MSLTVNRVAQVAHAAGFRGDALETAVAVSGAETGGTYNPTLDSAPNHTSGPDNGSVDRGLWQFNSYWHAEVSDSDAHDPDASARAAYRISRGGSSWTAWSTYNSGAYKAYLPAARAAVAALGAPDAGSNARTPVRFLEPDTDPAIDIRVGGQRMPREISYYLVAAAVEYTTQEASQLTLSFDDNDYLILQRFKLTSGPDGTPIEAAGSRWRPYSIGTRPGPKGPQTILVCQTSGVMRLRGFTPSAARHISPTQFMAIQAATAGLAFHGEQTAKQPHVGPQKVADPVTGEKRRENAWELGQRLAADRKMVCYESGGTLYFGTPQFLAETAKTWQPTVRGVSDGADFGVELPVMGWPTVTDLAFGSTRPKRTMAIEVDRSVGQKVRAGDELWLAGVPGLGGRVTATVTSVAWNLGQKQAPVTVQAADRSMWASQYASAGDAKASDLLAAPAGQVAGTVNLASKSAMDFVTLCLRQVGDTYVWGAGRNVNDPNPEAFDCSGLVFWACAQLGVKIGSWSGAQYDDCRRAGRLISISEAAATRGALLFEGAGGSQHVAVSLGDGKHTVEARGTAYGVCKSTIVDRPWSAAGLIPGLRYQ